jgi:hypothetical protein
MKKTYEFCDVFIQKIEKVLTLHPDSPQKLQEQLQVRQIGKWY